MRTTLEIIIAVKESQYVSFEELRLALMALSSIEHFEKNALDELIEAVEATEPLDSNGRAAKLRASFAKDTRERMFQALKSDPEKWLGPGGIPGTKEHDERYRAAIAVAKKAGVL